MIAPAKVANSSESPSRRSLRRLSPSPMENIRNTMPTSASVAIRCASATSANGGVNGPTTMPATKNPTITESPIR